MLFSGLASRRDQGTIDRRREHFRCFINTDHIFFCTPGQMMLKAKVIMIMIMSSEW